MNPHSDCTPTKKQTKALHQAQRRANPVKRRLEQSSNTPPPTAMAVTLLPFLPSEKRICDPRHHEMATAILTLADGLEAHIPGSRKRIADLEAILWAPLTGAFAGRYVRWSDS
jgi:hypothetical protein